MRRAVVLVGAVLLLAGCATPGAPGSGGPGGGEAATTAGPARDPVDLVGLWRVVADDVPEDTWLRLDAGSYQLWADCEGFLEGGWAASGRAFVASVPYGAVDGCGARLSEADGVAWLTSAVGYDVTGDERLLLDADGVVTATLRVDGAPEPIASAADFYTRAPEVDDHVRAVLRAEPAPLPDELAAASRSDLVGRWVPAGARNAPFAELSEDGTWTGSDGCNSASGAWASDDGGRLLTTSGLMTAIGCDGAPVPGWVGGAARAGFDGRTLVLLDADGTELGRLVPG